MSYAYIENNSVVSIYDSLPINWKNVSNLYMLEGDSTTLKSLGFKKIVETIPLYDETTQYLSAPIYKIKKDVVEATYTVITKPVEEPPVFSEPSEEEKQNMHLIAVNILRELRDALLKTTDHTQLNDVIQSNGPELTQQYIDYRQQLRDITELYKDDINFVNAHTVIFPIKPEAN